MKFFKQYSMSVPCLTKQLDIDEKPLFNGNLYINSEIILRFDPKGVTFVKDFFSGYRGDLELAELFHKDMIDSSKIDPISLNSMLKKNILVKEYNGNSPKRDFLKETISAFYTSLEVTQRCNAKCKQCYNGGERINNDPSIFDLENRINKLYDLGIRFIEISGGEPLIRNDLEDIVDIISKKRMMSCLLTNGYYLPENINILNKLNQVCISLDGEKITHDKMRGLDYSYDKVIESLSILKSKKITTYVSMTISDENYKDINHVISVCKKFGAKPILTKVIPTENALKNNLKLTKDINLLEDYIKIYSDSIKRPKFETNKKSIYYGCDKGRKGFAVTINGEVLPCIYNRKLIIGNILDFNIETFNTIVNSLRAEKISKLSNCKKCDDSQCGGPCDFSNTYKNWIINSHQ